MSATYEVHDGCTTCISDAGQAALAAEQQADRETFVRAEILLWVTAAFIVVFGVMVLQRILEG